MKLEDSIFEESYLTSFSQTGVHNKLTNISFLSLMETIAGAHSGYVNYSFNELGKENKAWVLLNWKLQVYKRPTADEKITIKTWGRFFNKLFTIRDFKMYNEAGELCAIASSKWCIVDLSTGKISRIPENIDKIYHGFKDESVFNIKDLPKLNVPETNPTSSDTYTIRRFDLDINKHVHNLNYLNYAYELLPEDVYYGEELNNVEISFKKEIKYKDKIKSFLYVENDVYTIVIKNDDESIVHAIIKLF